MGRTYNICQIDAFTDGPFNGNPAGVMFAGDLKTEEMQLIAKEMNLSETAFLSESNLADYKLRWFTPQVEVKLCGHATIASLHFLRENEIIKEGQKITFETLSGILACKNEQGRSFMQIPVPELTVYNGEKEEILSALGVSIEDADMETDWIILPSGYLYLKLKKLETLGGLKPDFKKLSKISVPGFGMPELAVYTLETIDEGSFVHSRFFAPGYGIDEDPVTGSANGPMLMVLEKLGFVKFENEVTSLVFEQGDFVGRAGRVTVEYNKTLKELFISGRAVTVIKGNIAL
jgi:PhzF family phenazine biosynthesis protein